MEKEETKPQPTRTKGKVLFVVFEGFEYFETVVPMARLREEGYEVVFASDKTGKLRGGHDFELTVEITLGDVRAEDFLGLHVPGGAEAGYPAVEFDLAAVTKTVCAFAEAKKPIFGICMGVGILARTGVLKDKTATCDPSTVETLKKGGGKHVNQPVATDGQFITSRFFPDLPHYCREMMMRLRRARPLLMVVGPGFEDLHVRGTFWRMQEIGFRAGLTCPDQKLWVGKAKLDERGVVIGRGGIGTWGVPGDPRDQKPEQYAGLVLPGGKVAVDVLKNSPEVTGLVRAFLAKGLPVAAVGEGIEILRATGAVEKRNFATEGSRVVVDGNLITALEPESLPEFWSALETLLRKP